MTENRLAGAWGRGEGMIGKGYEKTQAGAGNACYL